MASRANTVAPFGRRAHRWRARHAEHGIAKLDADVPGVTLPVVERTERRGAPRRPGGRRDRRGRGLRGRLVPAAVPLSRTRSQAFDDLVLDAVERIESRWGRDLAGVEFAVEDVPPELNVYDSDVLEDGEVPLARLLPGGPRHADGALPRIIVYRRPLEYRAVSRADLADLVHDVLVEQVANLFGVPPDELV